MGFLEHNENRAKMAGKGSSATTGKNAFKIEEAYYYKRNDGAVDVTLKTAPIHGGKSQFIKMNVVTKDGEDGYDILVWDSILGLTNCKSKTSLRIMQGKVDIKGEMVPVHFLTGLVGKEIGLLLRKDFYGNSSKDGHAVFSWDAKLAYNVETEQTYAEIMDNEPAKHVEAYAAIIKDRVRKSCVIEGKKIKPLIDTDIPTDGDEY